MSRIDLASKLCSQFSPKKLKETDIRNVANSAKIAKSNKDFSCYLKLPSNKYRKNSKISKLDEILDLEREKSKKGFEKSANFAKIAKETRISLVT